MDPTIDVSDITCLPERRAVLCPTLVGPVLYPARPRPVPDQSDAEKKGLARVPGGRVRGRTSRRRGGLCTAPCRYGWILPIESTTTTAAVAVQ